MANFVWGDAGSQLTPEAIAAQRKVAQAMMARGGDYSPIQSPWQGVARVAEGIMGGIDARAADAAERRNAAAERELISSLMPGAPTSLSPPSPVAAAEPAVTPSVSTPMGKTTIPGGKDEFINTIMPLAKEASARTGIDERIIMAQAAIETGWGRSAPGNNYFGIKSHGQPGGNTLPTTEVVNSQPVRVTDSFRAYASPAESAVGYADFINSNPRYRAVKSAQGLDAQVTALGQSGYATDPAYSAKVGAIARSLPEVAAAPAAAPASPAAPATPAAPTGINPRILQGITSQYVSEGTKKVLGILLQNQLQGEGVTTADAGNKIIVMDKRGNVVRELPKGEPNKGPEYGVIRKDDFGNEVYGFRDPRDKSTTETKPPAAATPAQPSTIPPAPPGVDPKVWREAQSKRATEEAMPASGDVTSKLRNEVQGLPSYKNIAQSAPVYKSMLDAAGRDNRAADVNLIYGMAKIMDPGSVVRESEMTVAQAVATLPQQLQAAVKSQLTGDGRLTPEIRAAIMQEARSRIFAYQGMFDQDMNMYRGIAKRGRMNEQDVIPAFGPFDEYRPPAPAVPQSVAPTQPAIDDLVKKYAP